MPLREQGEGTEPAFALGSPTPPPTGFGQYKSEVPSGIAKSVLSPRVQLTRRSKPKAIRRTPVIASYFLNPPMQEGLFSVGKIFQFMAAAVLNYQNTHGTSFFEDNPQLIILSRDEIESVDSFVTGAVGDAAVNLVVAKARFGSTEGLKRNYRTLCKRLAHYYYHYVEANKYYIASILNLLEWGKLNGEEPFKEIAYAFRWSVVNSNTAYYNRFPKPTGLEQAMAAATKIAIGETTFGASIYALPIWVTDIFGNRGFHSVDVASLINQADVAGQNIVSTDAIDLDEGTTVEAGHAKTLIQNIYKALDQFAYQEKSPRTPRIENGATAYYDPTTTSEGADAPDGSVNFHFKLNVDTGVFKSGSTKQGANAKDAVVRDNLIDSLWDSYNFWENYLISHFSEMVDVNNDKFLFARDQLKLIEQSAKPEDLLKVVRDAPTIKLTDLAASMEYKKDNSCTTATLCKYVPLLNTPEHNKTVDRENYSLEAAVFADNYERYDVDSSRVEDILANSNKFPHIAPTIFSFRAAEPDESVGGGTAATNIPFVMNGSLTPISSISLIEQAKPIVGKYASLFDEVCTYSLAPEDSWIESIGVDGDFVQKFIQSNKGIMFPEYPIMPFVAQQPLIDCTDIYQCGFNLLFSHNDKIGNEWTDSFKELSNYERGTTQQDIQSWMADWWDSGNPLTPTSINIWAQPSTTPNAASAKGNLMHVADKSYLDQVKHTFVFVGGAIFNHPLLRFAAPETGIPNFGVGRVDKTKEAAKVQKDVWASMARAYTTPSATSGWDDVVKIMFQAGGLTNLMGVDFADAYHVGGNAILKDICDKISTDSFFDDVIPVDFVTFMFDPTYGAVQPIVKQMPYGAYAAQAAVNPAVVEAFGATPSVMGKYYGKQADPCYTILNLQEPEGVHIVSPDSAFKQALYARMHLAEMFYLYFIRAFGWRPGYLDQTTGRIVMRENAVEVDTQGLDKWPLTLSAIFRVNFMGLEDKRYFWEAITDVAQRIDENTEGTSTPIPQENVIIEPKRAPRSAEPSPSMTRNGRGETSNKMISNCASAGYKSSSSGKSAAPSNSESSKSFGNKSPKKSGKSRRSYGKNDSYKESSKIPSMKTPYDEDPKISPVEVKNSDYSSDKTDRDFKKREKRNISGIPLQQG